MINQRLQIDEIFYGLQGEGNRMGFGGDRAEFGLITLLWRI